MENHDPWGLHSTTSKVPLQTREHNHERNSLKSMLKYANPKYIRTDKFF